MCIFRIAIACLLIFGLYLPDKLFAQNPHVLGSFPKNGTDSLMCNGFVSAKLHFPGEGQHVNLETLNNTSVRLFPKGSPQEQIRTDLEYSKTYKYIAVRPNAVLQPNTSYIFEINAGLTDERGNSFMPFKMEISTGNCKEGKLAFRGMGNKKKSQVPYEAYSKLSNFKADFMMDSILVTWQTKGESNIKGYVVERSDDGVKFDSLNYIGSQGNNENAQGYINPDRSSIYGNNFYRLKIEDNAGNSWYSHVVSVFKQKVKFRDLKIPMGEDLILDIKVAPQTTLVFLLKDKRGQVLRRKAEFMPWKENEMRIALNNVPTGIYDVVLITPKQKIRQSIKVVDGLPSEQ